MAATKIRVVAKDAPPPGDAPSGPTLNTVHSDAPMNDMSVAYVRAKKKKRRVVAKRETVTIVKTDATRQIVYGVALEPDAVDSQGDKVRPIEIEKAAHKYLAKAVRGQNSVHKIQHGARGFFKAAPLGLVPVESYIAPVDFRFTPDGEVIRKGSWVLAAHVEDPALWASVVKGEFTGWSVGGSGLRTPLADVAKDEPEPVVEKAIPAPDVVHSMLPAIHLHIDKDAFHVAPATTHVHNHIPEQGAPVLKNYVKVDAAPIPDVHIRHGDVHVHQPDPPEIHNHVTVGAKKPVPMRAVPQRDGSRVYMPVEDAG